MRTVFIWGAGGVGKSHTSIRVASREQGSRCLITMDPSRRLYHLLGADPQKIDQMVQLGSSQFRLRSTDFNALFDDLESKVPANKRVRLIYDQMASGLQDFRNYLDLIQLGDQIDQSDDELTIIDTPPFQEAIGFYKAMFHLHRFFDKSLVQWALRSYDSPVVQSAFRKVFDWLRLFSGRLAAQNLYDFIEWISQHSDRFRRSAKALEDLMQSEQTEHIFVVTPETHHWLIELFAKYFPKGSKIKIVMNRSLSFDELPNINHPFIEEMTQLKKKEVELERFITKAISFQCIEKIPLLFLGDDSPEEIIRFINA